MPSKMWNAGGESFTSKAKNEDEDVEGHRLTGRNIDDQGTETDESSDKPGVRVRVRVRNDDDDVEGHLGRSAPKAADDDVEGHLGRSAPKAADDDVEGHTTLRR